MATTRVAKSNLENEIIRILRSCQPIENRMAVHLFRTKAKPMLLWPAEAEYEGLCITYEGKFNGAQRVQFFKNIENLMRISSGWRA